MALFVLRYISSLFIFGLGLQAPGIVGNSPSNYHSFEDDTDSRARIFEGVSQ